MKHGNLGQLGSVSRLTLGGGGIGQVWGPTSREEASATLKAAVEGGIDLIDTAPMYLNCEAIFGETFQGALPSHVRVTSKCDLGSPPVGEASARLEASVRKSLEIMRLEKIDLFFLHSNIAAEGYAFAHGNARRDQFSTRWDLYTDEVIPTFERLKSLGLIGAWGITGIGVPQTILKALEHAQKPQAVQVITNLMDSAGGIRRFAEAAAPRTILSKAVDQGVPVLGIRAVQAGALTGAMDRELSPNHPDRKDFERALSYRDLCQTWGEDPADIAHRYALSMAGVDTLILGVKNRDELASALKAEAAGPLEPAQITAIDQLELRI
jgi:aryl-alcohol dehydrogenase-like predicted oxidoreductase